MLSWTIVGRQELYPRVSLVGTIRGEVSTSHLNALPSQGRTALEWRIPNTRWSTGVSRMVRVNDDMEWEVRTMLQLRSHLNWYVPQDIDRWPLGQRPGKRGPIYPSVEDRSANATGPLVPTHTP